MKKDNYLKYLLLILAFMIHEPSTAHDFEVDGIYYNINGATATVTFKGESYDSFSYEYAGEVNIPKSVTYSGTTYSVTSIDFDAFHGCLGLTSVSIPNSVTSIGERAFSNCTALTDIMIPNSVTSIGMNAFKTCHGLTSIEIPNSVTSIGDGAFWGCTGLTSIEIPNSVTSIGEDAFSLCRLIEIKVENGNTTYDSRGNCNAIIETSSNTLISGCKNTIIPSSVTKIGNYAFRYCRLTSIVIPNSVTSIGDGVFWSCSGLTSINIPNSVTSIGNYMLVGCSGLTSIEIPNSVTTIGDFAFYNCTGLTSINIPNSVTSIGKGALRNCPGLTSIEIPNSVTTISDGAFWDCIGLTSIEIPNSVTSIGDGVFWSCTGLTSINIPNSVTSIGNSMFYGCTGLTSIEIPNSVTTIGASAFCDCFGLTTIDIPYSVTDIRDFAFEFCTGLTSINIGNSVTSIGECAFNGCNDLTNVYCYAVNPPTCLENTFETYSATLHVPASSLAAYFTAPYWCNFENIIGDAVVPTAINISKDSVDLLLTEQIKLTATVTPVNASNIVISWHSTNTGIATVDNGNVTAIGIGECDIIATCFGMQDTCHIAVTNPIKLDQQEVMLLPNHILTLSPTAPAVPEGYTVSSSDPTVAAVRVMNGKVQVVGIKEGTTTITVGSTDGLAIPATCLVTVYTEPGDLNSDGFVNISDVTSLIDYILGGDETSVTMKNADVNGDGRINIADVTSLIDTILSKSE